MGTFSVNINTGTESNSYDLLNQFDELLFKFRDNDDGFINPIDLRDGFLSLWSNSIFKETRTETSYYIGIDGINPEDRDVKRKILLGKRSNDGNDIFNDPMSNNDTDIYISDTKSDNNSNGETRVSILAGLDRDIFLNAPYISSKFVSGVNNLSLDIINNGNIDITSDDDHVSINNIRFPKSSESQDINNKSLVWNDGKLEWGNISLEVGNNVGDSSSEINLQGDTFLNSYPLEFTDDRMIPVQIGSIKPKESFDSLSLSELLKRVIYSYQAPSGDLSFLPPYNLGFIEVGTSPNVTIEYRIDKRTLPTLVTTLGNMSPNTVPGISGDLYEVVTGTSSAIISPSPALPGTQSYTITTSDGLESNSKTLNLSVIYPFYFGIGINNSQTYTGMNFLIKKIEGKSDKELPILGSGNIYFFYPIEYGPLSQILDNNGLDITSNFTFVNFNYSSTEGNWSSKSYYIYKSDSIFTINSTVLYSFKF